VTVGELNYRARGTKICAATDREWTRPRVAKPGRPNSRCRDPWGWDTCGLCGVCGLLSTRLELLALALAVRKPAGSHVSAFW